MAMKNCSKCLENVWEYKHVDGYIIATCKMCGNEVMFPDKKHKKDRHVDNYS